MWWWQVEKMARWVYGGLVDERLWKLPIASPKFFPENDHLDRVGSNQYTDVSAD